MYQQQSMDLTGVVLGWNNALYRLTSSVKASIIGRKLGEESYHGNVSGLFTIFQLRGVSPGKSVVFESSNDRYYKAIATKSPH